MRHHKHFANLLFWVIWASLAMLTKINRITLVEMFDVYLHTKNQLHPPLLFEMLQGYYKVAILGTWGIPINGKYIWYCQLVENFGVYLHTKKHIYPSPFFFLKYYKEVANLLFLILWACPNTPTISNSTTLWEILMLIQKQKINLILQFFLEILHIKESCNLIGQEHFAW